MQIEWKQISKAVAHQLVAMGVAHVTQKTIINHTEIDPDSKLLKLGSWAVGELAADATKTQTDAAVDWAAEKLTSKKDNNPE
jgi:hypothetical protein